MKQPLMLCLDVAGTARGLQETPGPAHVSLWCHCYTDAAWSTKPLRVFYVGTRLTEKQELSDTNPVVRGSERYQRAFAARRVACIASTTVRVPLIP